MVGHGEEVRLGERECWTSGTGPVICTVNKKTSVFFAVDFCIAYSMSILHLSVF